MLSKNEYYSPKVAIIGRPNVGKSTLFNVITGTRKSVVKNQSGVTRDIIIEPAEVWGKQFDLIDTGGITEAADVFSQLIREQVVEFLQTVDFLLVVMDGRAGLMPEDRDLIRIAKMTAKPFVIIINKVDRVTDEEMAKADFYEFGADIISASFEQRRGVSDILEWLNARITNESIELKQGTTVTMVGKPNVGKSSMCNYLLGSHRMLVSDIAGTTVDSVDSPFVYNGKRFTLIDTAGLRKRSKQNEDIEVIASFKSQESIRRADIVLLMIDGTVGPTDQDAKIMNAILDDHKGVIVVANKSDIGGKTIEDYRKVFKEQMADVFHFYEDVPIVFTSAKTGSGIRELFETIERVSEKLAFRVPTGELNDFFFETIRKAPAPVWGTTNVKFYYLTQTFQRPPAFIAFANHPDGVSPGYRRFLVKHIKDRWDLHGIPIRIFVMKSRSRE
jgi:GTPase